MAMPDAAMTAPRSVVTAQAIRWLVVMPPGETDSDARQCSSQIDSSLAVGTIATLPSYGAIES
jgi:hypothetical protein